MHLEGYGCAGTSATAYGVACRELEAVDSGLRSFVSVQGSLAMFALHRWGSEEQKEEWLPRMATGEAIGCFGLTESDAGSDPGSMKTHAKKDGDDWVLNGSKMWITNGTLADVAVVWAQTDDGHPRLRRTDRHEGLRGPQDQAQALAARLGHRRARLRRPAAAGRRGVPRGARAQGSAVVPQRGPLRHRLGRGRRGPRLPRGVAGLHQEREQFGKPLASFQLTQRKLALMAVAVNNASLVAWRLGALKDAGTLTPIQVSYGKYANVRAALDVAREARTTLGGAGITLDHTVMRHMNNLETVMTYEGTEEMHLLSVGAELTGIPAFR